MDKKIVRLVDFFEQYPKDLFNGLSELVIEKFDFYQNRTSLSLSGYSTMSDDNSLSGFYKYFKSHLDMDIVIRFTDFDEESDLKSLRGSCMITSLRDSKIQDAVKQVSVRRWITDTRMERSALSVRLL